MGVKMEIECGTMKLTKFEIDLDDYGTNTCGTKNPVKRKQAYDLLRDTMNDETFIDDHCRNEDAVNSCIALHVMGYYPPEWFENFLEYNDEKFFDCDIEKFLDHVYRVCGHGKEHRFDPNYLLRWGPEGHEENALNYTID